MKYCTLRNRLVHEACLARQSEVCHLFVGDTAPSAMRWRLTLRLLGRLAPQALGRLEMW